MVTITENKEYTHTHVDNCIIISGIILSSFISTYKLIWHKPLKYKHTKHLIKAYCTKIPKYTETTPTL